MAFTLTTPSRMLFLLAALLPGCGASEPEGPPLYVATGKVTYVGGRPFPGGIITLTLQSDATITADGEVGDDGTFTLFTTTSGQRRAGAREGAYQVMISSRFNAATGGVSVFQLPRLTTIEAKENQLAFEVDPGSARR